MIYDCFSFFNELDLLEIRLQILDPVVDRFVLVEATRTFQKKTKPLYFEKNKARFEKFLPKIEHIVVDKYPSFLKKLRKPTPWDYENAQRESMLVGLKNARPNDQIIVSDVDEIPRPELVRQYAGNPGIKVFQQRLYYFFINNLCVKLNEKNPEYYARHNQNGLGFWYGTVMLPYHTLQQQVKTIKKARLLRDLNEPQVTMLKDAGWHFSYLGGAKMVAAKLAAYAHNENNTDQLQNIAHLEKLIQQGEDPFGYGHKFNTHPVDSTLPAYLVENINKYAHLVKAI